MRLTHVVTMEINHRPEDVIPVKVGDQIVGRVISARAVYIDGQEHTQIVVEIDDDIVKKAIEVHVQTQRPVFSIFFPRAATDTDHVFKVN